MEFGVCIPNETDETGSHLANRMRSAIGNEGTHWHTGTRGHLTARRTA